MILADILTLVLAYLASRCWWAVIVGTAAVNSDGGIAVVFTFLAVFMGVMSWIGHTER